MPRDTSVAREKDVVYGTINESLVFVLEYEAHDLATTWEALATCRTWGEYRTRAPESKYQKLLEYFDYGPSEDDEPIPEDDEPFDGHSLGCVSDGDYPEWPAQEMLAWMPQDIRTAEFGSVVSSTLNGPFLRLDPRFEPEIVSMLAAAGYRCRKNQALVERASGYDTLAT